VRTAIASVAVLAGAAFMLVAGLGLARLPDLYTRMHAATKPATVGVVAIMSGVALALYEVPVTARAALVALFFLLTAPVAAHAIARSAHSRRVALAPGTRIDDGATKRERPPQRRSVSAERSSANISARLGGESEREQRRLLDASAPQKEERS
jgi:multicomponent Na+:H+ antiporter subunit G